MKKILMILLCAVILVGCGENKVDESLPTISTVTSNAEEDTTLEESSEEQTSSETQEETQIKTIDDVADEVLGKLKSELYEIVKDFEANESTTMGVMELFEGSYWDVEQLEDYSDSGEEFMSEFLLAIAYFSSKFEEDTIGKSIGDKGWEAVESLMRKDGDFKKKMSELKTLYEYAGCYLFKNVYSEGQYKVGTDIPAGEYVVFATGDSGYFKVSSDSNGNDIIANENFSYNSIIGIKDGEYFKLSRSKAVSIDEVPTILNEEANMYKIGMHLPAGEYKLIADSEMAYYCIYNDNRQDDIEANDNFASQSYITVSNGQYLLLNRCHIESD